MKKSILLFSLFLLPLMVSAEEAVIDGIKYNLVKKVHSAEVVSYELVDDYWGTTYSAYSGNIVIPASVEYEGETYSVTSIGEEAFSHCKSLTSIIIPNSVTSFGCRAFSCCSSLTSITIPESVTSIGNYAFYGCSSLTSVTIPNSVSSISYEAFSDCSSLISVTIPESVTLIDNYAFTGCSSLISVIIPNSVTQIGLEAFSSCSSLTSISIPESVSIIDDGAFYNCSSLTSITIPESVTSIGNSVFWGCSSLTSVTIPNSITSISYRAFFCCNGLASVTIPNSITQIGLEAFSGCGSLATLSIGEGVRQIYSHAFEKNEELMDVYCYAKDVPNAADDAFEGSYIDFVTLHVPAESVEKYLNSAFWSQFKTIVAIDGGGETQEKCAPPAISYENGKLSVTCETEGAVCYYSTSAATLNAKDYTVYSEDSELSDVIQLTVSAYAVAEGYEKSEIVSRQVSVPVGKVIKEYIEIHDTTYVNVEVHDTTYVDVPFEVLVHDTTYVNVEVHDTTFVDVPYEVIVFDTISVPTTQEIPAPTIVVDNGIVEILSGAKDAVIYFTLDGTTPVVCEENRYNGPFPVSGDCTISAIAVLQSDAASKEVIDGIWHPSQTATLRYFRTNGVETETTTNGVNIVYSQTADGKTKVTKRIVK